jgi:hypothetical protein
MLGVYLAIITHYAQHFVLHKAIVEESPKLFDKLKKPDFVG